MKHIKLEDYDKIDYRGNVIKQLIEQSNGLVMDFGEFKATFTTYENFLLIFEETDIPCWCCGRALFRIRGSDYLKCYTGKLIGTPCDQEVGSCNHKGNCRKHIPN